MHCVCLIVVLILWKQQKKYNKIIKKNKKRNKQVKDYLTVYMCK
jgi:hypothetical protein